MRTFCCLLVALLWSAAASASPFTWVVEGQIAILQNQNLAGPYAGLFAAGQPFTWSITMESTAPDFNPLPECGQYAPITANHFRSGSVDLATISTPGQDYVLHTSAFNNGPCDGPPEPDVVRLRSGPGGGLMMALYFGGIFATDALPVDASLVYPFALLDIFYGSFGNPIANARIESITAVPEPLTGAMLVLGIAGLVRRRRMGR